MNESELIEFLKGIEKSVGELSKRIEKLEYGLKFLELNDRLDKIESMCFSENTLSNRADELRETLFSHILCIYLYRNTTNNFHHWCMEVNAKICGILSSRLKKGGRHPSREQALNAVLDSTFLLEDGLPMMLTKIFNKGRLPPQGNV